VSSPFSTSFHLPNSNDFVGYSQTLSRGILIASGPFLYVAENSKISSNSFLLVGANIFILGTVSKYGMSYNP
jgi:hypothetical protein